MTEDEAKTKWCPAARSSADQGDYSANRRSDGKVDIGCFCIASDCMAWRWHRSFSDGPLSTEHGTCGLAGKQ